MDLCFLKNIKLGKHKKQHHPHCKVLPNPMTNLLSHLIELIVMNTVAKNKLLTWLVILLLVANAASIAMFWLSRGKNPPPPKGTPRFKSAALGRAVELWASPQATQCAISARDVVFGMPSRYQVEPDRRCACPRLYSTGSAKRIRMQST